MTRQGLDKHQCLAWEVLRRPEHWLGKASPTALHTFLNGASARAAHIMHEAQGMKIPSWRVFGPLHLSSFDVPLLARTGQPTLTIRWPCALELLHFSMTDALDELRALVDSWFETQVEPYPTKNAHHFGIQSESFDDHWSRLARRPGMYLGEATGDQLHSFLNGMTRGGDWLELPSYQRANEIQSAIEAHSNRSYGSPFGAYRVYTGTNSVRTLLSWAGIERGDN